MAGNSTQEALLSDSPNVLARHPSRGAKRFRRCRSTPTELAAAGSLPQAKPLFKGGARLVGLILFVYLLAGVIIFYLVMDQMSGIRTNRVLDALYLVIVTVTSVGCEDLVPNSDTTKLLACAFVFSGMAIFGIIISKLVDRLVEMQEVFVKAQQGEAKMLNPFVTNKIKYKFCTVALLLLMNVTAGTVFLWKVEKLSLVDSFYCVLYGDKSFPSKFGRVFAICWIITSTLIMAQFFQYLGEYQTERVQNKLKKWVLTRRTTTMDLEAADINGDRQVGAAEFVLYKLKELGKISEEEISCVLQEFEKLDVDHSGTLSTYELTLGETSQ